MARKASDDCMFCDTGDCPTHSPKPTVKKLRAPVVPKPTPQPVKAEAVPSKTAAALQSRLAHNADDQLVVDAAIRALAPILADGELIKYRKILGSDVRLRISKWRQGR